MSLNNWGLTALCFVSKDNPGHEIFEAQINELLGSQSSF